MRRGAGVVVACAAAAGLALGPAPSARAAAPASGTAIAGPRASSPIVLTGSQVPAWSRPAATGVAQPYPSGTPAPLGDGVRSAHDGTIVVPPDVRSGVDVDDVAAYRWDGAGWVEVPVQVDQRFPNFLANARSDFGIYSGVDPELTYSWAPDAHADGAESWRQVFGTCRARYATDTGEVEAAVASGLVTLGPQETAADWLGPMADPVPTLDDDDEIALDASDAGAVAPVGTPAPSGVDASSGQEVRVVDPLAPQTAAALYLFLRPGGSSFTPATGHVQAVRDADASDWIDRHSFLDGDPEALGVSNTGYGPNLEGTVCSDPGDGSTARASTDRFPRDGWTVSTDLYRATASGRWMVRGYQVTSPDAERQWGPDLIDRWKGRAFQQSPDSSISLVGFEDEQVNWEANSALLGWRAGPVRAIREVWGADSGTNVTKTETWYRGADVFRYRLRVHPIPPDGLYTSWDYNLGVAARYYDVSNPDGVPIDGVDDELVGNVNSIPVPGEPVPAYFDVTDPTTQLPSAVLRPEEVAGRDDAGAAVYVFQINPGPGTAVSPLVVPYYRDDACLDDGTGDDPVQRPWPGEASTDPRVQAGYGGAGPDDCDPGHGLTPFQGAVGSHGVHFFATVDTDNAATPLPITELDGQQWRYAAPMAEPTNVLLPYGENVVTPLVPVVLPFAAAASGPSGPSGPSAPAGGPTPTEAGVLPRTDTDTDATTATSARDGELARTGGSSTAPLVAGAAALAALLTRRLRSGARAGA